MVSLLTSMVNLWVRHGLALAQWVHGGSQQGFTIVNFVVLYCIGAWLRISNVGKRFSTKQLMIAVAVSFVLIFTFAEISHYTTHLGLISAWCYHNPFIIILAVLFILLFSRLKFYSRFVNSCAKAAFMTYIVHVKVIGFMYPQFHVNGSVWALLLYLLFAPITLYTLSIIVNLIYDKLLGCHVTRCFSKCVLYFQD